MRYVLINERFSFGGAEMQSLREKHLMESKGHKVLYITFDNEYPQGWNRNEPCHYNFAPHYSRSQRRLSSYITDRSLARKALKLIDGFRPGFIHVNNSIGYAYAVSFICRKYKTVRTFRDYSAVCTNGFCTDRNKRVCEGGCRVCCLKRCMPGTGRRQFVSDWYKFRKRMREDLKAVDIFVSPSRTLAEYCCHNGIKTYCLNNPFDFSMINTNAALQRKGRIRKFLYYGLVAEHKGVRELIDAFREFSKDKDVTLDIAGQLYGPLEDSFGELIAGCDKITYHGKLPYPETIKLLSGTDCVAVPSLWMENYPNTVLEGLASGCIVIASDRGGMKEMIRDDRMIFDVLDRQDIISKLRFVYDMSESERQEIIRRNIGYVTENNSLEMYYRRFMKLVSVLTDESRQAQNDRLRD